MKTKTIIMTKGLPGAGKSTYAEQIYKNNPGKYKVICRDKIRDMLDFGKWSKANEKLVNMVKISIVKDCLESGYIPIVADCNLHEKNITGMRQIFPDVEIEIKDFTDVPIETCIKQDLMRTNSVGKDVILKQYEQFIRPTKEKHVHKEGLEYCALIDLDGTLVDSSHRSPYDYSKITQDTLRKEIFEILKAIEQYYTVDESFTIIFITGRDDFCKEDTLKWIKENTNWGWCPFFCRPEGDKRSDYIVKKEIYDQHIKDKYNVLFAFEDRDRVTRMWKDLGITVIDVGREDYEF